MPARLDAPVFGATGGAYATGERHQVGASWRYFKSDRHFVGPEFQKIRKDTKSQFINRVHMLELSHRYLFNDRWSLQTAVPIFKMNRNQPLRIDGVVIDRFETDANGLGDVTVTAKRWMLRPETHPNGNFTLGMGLKLPTGNEHVLDYRWRLVDGVPTKDTEKQPVDQSIQLGDGGVGYIADLQWFQGIADGKMTFYGGATYLFSPKEESKSGHSASDQYLGRLGAVWTAPSWKGFAFGLGGRLEGVPWDDVFRGNEGSRRPGYAISVEPTFSYRRGRHGFLLSTPIMAYANRTRSVRDRERDAELVAQGLPRRGPGDAAFAPYTISFGYSYRFGQPVQPRTYADTARKQPVDLLGTESALILPACKPTSSDTMDLAFGGM